MVRVFVVEDEHLARERLKRLLKRIPEVEVVGEAKSKQETVEKIKELNVDVVFLDIRLPDGTGLELAKEIMDMGLSPYIIFITAYGEYALEAFKVNAVDYILKPYELEDLQRAINKVKDIENKKANLTNVAKLVETTHEFFIPIRYSNKLILLKPEDIYYIKAEFSEAVIRTKDGEYFSNKKLYELENLLKGKGFFRVHRRYLVNLSKIKEMRVAEQSKFVIYFDGINETVKTSREGAKALREYLGL